MFSNFPKKDSLRSSSRPSIARSRRRAQSTGGERHVILPDVGIEEINSETPAVIFKHVCKTYDKQPNHPALNDVSVEIGQGEFVFLVGHSGSGKSTFIRCINREVTIDSGSIIVGGYDIANMRQSQVPYLRRNIGCVFQDYKLLPNKTAYENVAFAMECVGAPKRDIAKHVPDVLALVGLKDKMNKYPDELSGGEQQRVSVARALVNRPPLLICDEPTGNLDPDTSRGIIELLLTINMRGITVLIATHDQDIVNELQTRVIRLSKGHVVADEEGGYVQ